MNRVTYISTPHPTVVKQQYHPQNVWAFENRWRTDLFSCEPMGRFCFGWFCPLCMTSQIAEYMGESSLISVCPGSLLFLRTKLRTARRIQGSYFSDCMATVWCPICVRTQMVNELESQGLWEIPKVQVIRQVTNEPYVVYQTNANGTA